MTETCPFKLSQSLLRANNTSYEEETNMKKKERKNSINSSSPEVSFNNLNSEIKSIIENETDLSFTSHTNSEIDENKTNIDHLFDSKYWRASKETNSETDEPFSSYDS
jgi:flagellar basal body P-ring protein FlgI